MSVAAVPCSQSSLRLESSAPWALGPAFPSPGCSASAAQTQNISPRCSGSLPAALQFSLPSPAHPLADIGSNGRDGQQRCSGGCQAHELTGFQGKSDLRDGGGSVPASAGACCSCATAATVDRSSSSSSSSSLSDESSSPIIGPEPEPDQNQSLASDADSPRQRQQEQQQQQEEQPGPDRRTLCAAVAGSCGAAAADAAAVDSAGSSRGRALGAGSRGRGLADAPGGAARGGSGGADVNGGADANGGAADDRSDRRPADVDAGADLAGRRRTHLHASTSSSPGPCTSPSSLREQPSRSAVHRWPWVADLRPASAPRPAGPPGHGRHLCHENCGASGDGAGRAAAGAVVEPACGVAALPSRGGSGGGASDRSSCSGATATATVRRPVYGVKTSQITSQITAAQRVRAAVVIQAAWRGFRIRRLYLRLIVWRLRPPSWQREADDQVYRGLRELPPIPDLPAVSLFTLFGRPSRFRGPQRRVWFGMEEVPAAAATGGGCVWRCRTGAVQLHRVAVPPRAEADVPMAEVERILAGGFWRDEPAAVAPAAGDGGTSSGAGGGGGDGEGLSMYMRAKMRQEEREAEEALQMLSYEPHDLKHLLGSLKERTLERLGDLGRTIGETLASRRLRGPHGPGPAGQSLPRQGWWGSCGCGTGAGGGGGGSGAAGRQRLYCMGQSLPASSLPHPATLRRHPSSTQPPPHTNGAAAGSTHGGFTLPFSLTRALTHAIPGLGSLGGGGGCQEGSSSLRVPLLHVVDAEGRTHMEVPPGGAAIPIEVNRRRYRCRSHVSRMSF